MTLGGEATWGISRGFEYLRDPTKGENHAMSQKRCKHLLPSSRATAAAAGAARPNTKPLSPPGQASFMTRALILLSAYYLASVNSTTSSYITDTRTTSALYTYVPDDDDSSSSGSTSPNGTCVVDDTVCEADTVCTDCLSLSSRQGNSGQPCEVRYPDFLHSNASLCEQVAASYCCYYEDESTAETCLANVPTADYWNCVLTNMGMDCVIEDMPCYGGALVGVEPQNPAPSTNSTSAINETPLSTTLAPITTATVETPSPSTATIMETLSPSTAAVMETPSPSTSDRELPSASPGTMEPTSPPSTTVEPTNLHREPFPSTSTHDAAPVQSSAPTVESTVSTMSEASPSSRGAVTQAPTLVESSDADNSATGANDASTLVAGPDAPWKLVGFAWVLGICLVTVMY